jgi:hypothetical protein
MGQFGLQACFDLLLGQNKGADPDEELRPYSEIDKIGSLAAVQRETVRQAEQKGNAPSQGHEQERSRSYAKRIVLQQFQLLLQFEEGPSVRREKFAQMGISG